MRMLDYDSDKVLNNVLILLTKDEAEWLSANVMHMLSSVEQEHYHIMDMEDGRREFILGLYDEVNIEKNTYVPRVIDLIRDDE